MLAATAVMSQHEQRFELLADLGAMIAGEALLDDLLATLAERVARALGAQRATLWLIDNASGEIRKPSNAAGIPLVCSSLKYFRFPRSLNAIACEFLRRGVGSHGAWWIFVPPWVGAVCG